MYGARCHRRRARPRFHVDGVEIVNRLHGGPWKRCVRCFTIVDAIALAMARTLGRASCIVGITSVGALLSTSQHRQAAGTRATFVGSPSASAWCPMSQKQDPVLSKGVDRGWGEGAPQACRALWRPKRAQMKPSTAIYRSP